MCEINIAGPVWKFHACVITRYQCEDVYLVRFEFTVASSITTLSHTTRQYKWQVLIVVRSIGMKGLDLTLHFLCVGTFLSTFIINSQL